MTQGGVGGGVGGDGGGGGGGGGGWRGGGEQVRVRFEWQRSVFVIVVSALKKHEKHRRTQFHETSPQGSTLMMLYTL